ncbi:type I-E CRISPR-associated protein Cas7/Cse4/CasC [Nonomuraea sp. NEAU-A123]|uniref:type I-E CRISPR-associated protein Cas7/Cse4/CasC n=1 Tax=Nonomuraea sp. NEAU-A123 TaxID=2839649 RepID=UPI001BE47D2F|nr:type I-E CRISPR-associated protein Cas7/Cse4/CasC [Nonomuraea sp. NEAU-A123]MBT2234436.1 type I-E CRISPR-associated protein Cas7/Cse4/CasC [Nonomuraea sp. NEAU-A123]
MDERLYIDVHIIQTVPPANLNRDDQGNPKEAYFGGHRRARVSSQAWKRATRTSFAKHAPQQDHATRTKRIVAELAKRLAARTGLAAEQAARLSTALLEPLGIKAGKKAGDTAYLLFFGYRQLEDIIDLVAGQADDLAALEDEQLAKAVKDLPVAEKLQTGHPMDVALFGRMVADIPSLNVDAATQVAHALSTHAVELEFDYYTAVDDENLKEETGAGMIGTIGFNSATLYRYATIGLPQLISNLGDSDAALTAVDAFIEHFARSIPSGHQNSFAHRTLPSLLAVVVRQDQPVNLVSAYEKPLVASDDGEGLAAESAVRLAVEYDRATRQWGDTPAHTAVCHTFDPDGHTGERLTTIIGANTTFPTLIANLHATLAKHLKQAR